MDTPDLHDRLLAILEADVAGYSRLMSLDDRSTVAALDAARAVFREQIAAHGGRVIDTAGDSVLSVFGTATGAVAAALAIQQRLSVSAADVPEERRMRFRIGIHVGDIIEKTDGTVYGDGVNIASRLEALAVPGAVAVSQAVHDMVVRRVDALFEDIGEQTVKNIAQPVRAYRVRHRRPGEIASPESTAGDETMPARNATTLARLASKLKTLKGAIVAIASLGAVLSGLAAYWNTYQAAGVRVQSHDLLALVGKGDAGPLSIVVLPFANLTGDPQQAYVADGLTVAVTADLSRIRDAFIVSAATALAFRDKPVTVQQVGKELGVRFALQGGIQRSGDTIRISAQLADTTSNAQLWSESFDGSQADLFALQDRVTTRIGNSIGREMVIVAARDSEMRKSDPKVADLLVRARALVLKPTSLKIFEERQSLYRQALLLEPSNVQAMVGLAGVLAFAVDNGFIADPVVIEKRLVEGRDLALKAREVDSGIANIYSVLGVYAYRHDDFEGARRDFATALSLEPKEPMRYNAVAWGYLNAGDPVKAIELLSQAIRLDPRNLRELFLENMGRAQFMNGNDEAAIEWLLKAVDVNPAYASPQAYLAMAYARKGDRARARAAAVALLQADPKYSLSKSEAPWPGQPAAFREWWETKLLPAWRLAGLPE